MLPSIRIITSLFFISFNILCASSSLVFAENLKTLSFDNFIKLAIKRDSEFEQILIDELNLKYQKSLSLPAKDLVLAVKHQHEFYLSQDRDSPSTTVALNKLFPFFGTELSTEYEVGATVLSDTESSKLSFTIAHPIAQNAFGKSTRLLDKIVGLEVDIAQYQIMEAYEDYYATIILAYYSWFTDYQNLLVAQASYSENLKLLDNMNERHSKKIALRIDVNKVELQVLSKKDKLILLEEKYKNSTSLIYQIIRDKGNVFIPENAKPLDNIERDFNTVYENITRTSRTFEILRMLEDKSTLSVERDADELLPSIDLISGYELKGEDYRIDNDDNLLFVGLTFGFPFFQQVEKAEYQVSKIAEQKQKLQTVNTYYKIYTQLMNVYLAIDRERQLIETADKRIEFAESILKDERDNYSFGKITLNDYISAYNVLDNNKFNKISHENEYRKLIIEWLRLSDQLISGKEYIENK